MAAARYRCKTCLKDVVASGRSPSPLRYRKHDNAPDEECANSRTIIPAWIVKRGPETEGDDRPVIGRDYGPCPDCGRSPLLDDEGMFADHVVTAGVPAADRVVCEKSGKPYEGDSCPASGTPASPASESGADSASSSNSPSPSPNESEELISKWAATAREIEERKLPPPSPESTTTPPSSPPQYPCHITGPHPPHKWMHQRRQAQCPGKPAPTTARTEHAPDSAEGAAGASEAVPSSTESSGQTPADALTDVPTGPPPDIAALAAAFPKETLAPATAAGPATADAVATPADVGPFVQPGSPFSQPGAVEPAPAAVPMSVMAEQLVARMREIFFSYGNRKTDDNRSAQSTLGPSEIGSPCDRRIAMALLRIPAVNPGEGWASFKGTAIHAALADMFTWASGNTGRFAVEVPLTFPSELVPRGTTDLLDRILFMVDDHKIQSRWSQNKLRTEGMTSTQRVQLHVYGYGERLQGERVDHVALLSWPMESSSLDDLYVVVEPYDPQIARDALARVDRIADRIQEIQTPAAIAGTPGPSFLQQAAQFPVADDCKFCEWFAPGDAAMERGCNGRA